MYSEKLLDHFQNPRHAGELAPPAVTVEVSNPVCGDTLRLSAALAGGRVTEARFLARGCPPAMAAGSALSEWLVDQPLAALAGLDAAQVEAMLGGLPAASRHAAALCVDAVRALLEAMRPPTGGTRPA